MFDRTSYLIRYRIGRCGQASAGVALKLLLLVLLAGCAPLLADTITIPDCGGKDQRACTMTDNEFWNGGNGFCDTGLKPSNGYFKAIFAAGGTCVNSTRDTVGEDKSWAAWALSQQRNGIQKHLPINFVTTLGTHGSHSNYQDGNRNLLNLNQYYSMTDQLNQGARLIRIDPQYYFGQVRAAHCSSHTQCESLGVAQAIGAALALAPFVAPINLLIPYPIPAILNTALIAAAPVATYSKVTNRLWAWSIQEINDWLVAHPNEVIILTMSDGGPPGYNFPSGARDNSPDRYINVPLSTYFGSKIFTPADLAARPATDGARYYPSLKELIAAGKQIIIMNGRNNPGDPEEGNFDAARSYCIAGGDRLPGCPYLFTGKAESSQPINFGVRNSQFDNCTIGASGYRSYQRDGKWVNMGEGRTLVDIPGDELNEADVRKATGCGISLIALDYFLHLGSAPASFRRSGADLRREATIWSYAEGDFGNIGPAVMNVSTGRWTSYAPASSLPAACQVTNGNLKKWDTHTWRFTASTSFFRVACPSGTTFAHPEHPADNVALQQAAAQANLTQVWLNYSAVSFPPVGVTPTLLNTYMDRTGAAPEPGRFMVDGFPQYSFRANLSPNTSNLVSLDPVFNTATSLEAAAVPIALPYNPANAQTLPAGAYTTTLNVVPSPAATSAAGFLVTHVMEPTRTALSVDPAARGAYDPDTPVLFRARVAAACGRKPNDPISGGSIGITGGVTFSDTYTPLGASSSVTRTLGRIPINNFQDNLAANSNGMLTAVSCPGDDLACASTKLEPGQHIISATYGRDSTYGSSSSDSVTVTVPGIVSPARLEFVFPANNTSPQSQTLTATQIPGAITTSAPSVVSVARVGTSNQYNVTVAPGSRVPGTHEETVTMGTATIGVVMKIYGSLAVDARPLSFASTNQAVPTKQQVLVNYEGGPITATPDTGWITASLTPASNTTRQLVGLMVDIGVDPHGLAAGVYNGSVKIASPGQTPVVVPVTLNLTFSNVQPILVTSTPPGLSIQVDGVNYKTPQTFLWTPESFRHGNSHVARVVETAQVLTPGTRAVFREWPGFSEKTFRTIRSQDAVVQAAFDVEYELASQVSPACTGTVNPPRQWIKSGTSVNVVATASTGNTFQSFQGDITSTSKSQTFTMTSPKSILAKFACASADCVGNFPPVSVATLGGNPFLDFWSASDVTVSLSAVAGRPNGTVQEIRYSTSGAVVTPLTTIAGSRVNVPIRQEGITTITFYAVDRSGDAEVPRSVVVKIDKTPPTATFRVTPTPTLAGWNNTNVVAVLECADSLSGVNAATQNFGVSASGTTTLTRECVDRAGNRRSATVKVYIDRTPPVLTLALDPAPNAAGWNRSDVNVVSTCTDATGGAGVPTTPAPVRFTTEGTFNVSRTCTDAAGNVATAVATVRLDKTPPTIAGLPPTGCTIAPPDGRLVSYGPIQAVDERSGIGALQLGATSPSTLAAGDVVVTTLTPSSSSLSLRATSGSTARIYNLAAQATDAAGNIRTASAACTVAPVTGGTPPPPLPPGPPAPPPPTVLPGDANRDGVVDCKDLALVRLAIGKKPGDLGFDVRADVNSDGLIDLRDFQFVAQRLPAGSTCP
ncbi:MAG: dockerin type I domain-containing protein [Acidobacteria bacterium]|nr:dockerin type I domain-containing protein [Acidobacteriota bacterium]